MLVINHMQLHRRYFFLPFIQHLQLNRNQLFTFYSAFPAGQMVDFSLVFSICIVICSKNVMKNLIISLPHSIFNQFIIKLYHIKDILQENLYLCDPTVKFCLEHPQKPLQIFNMKKQVGRFGLVKPGHPSKVAPICLV